MAVFDKAVPQQDSAVKELTDALRACVTEMGKHAGAEGHGLAMRRAEELLKKHAPEGS